MNDLFDILSLLCVVSLSVGLALFLQWIFSLIKTRDFPHMFSRKRHYRCSTCIEGFCVCFSVSIASLAAILIFIPWQSIFNTFTRLDNLYYILLFFSAFVVVFFFRVLAPVAISIYILYVVVFALLFVHSYSPSPKNVDMEIAEPSTVSVYAITISFKNLLPLPRHWISDPIIQNITETEVETDVEKNDFSLFSPVIELVGADSLFATVIESLSSLIIDTNSKIEKLTLSLGDAGNLPAQHTIEFAIEKGGVIAEVF